MHVRHHAQAGFSLLEVVIACLVLAVGVLSLAGAAGRATAAGEAARHWTIASVVATQKLEELKAARGPVAGRDAVDRAGRVIGVEGGDGPAAYVREWTVRRGREGTVEPTVFTVVVTPVAEAARSRGNVFAPGAVRLSGARPGRIVAGSPDEAGEP